MLRVGLTGGMGAGKSTVAAELARLGATIIDADAVAREVVEPGTPGLAALVDEFGEGILAEDGSLDRPALAAVAFGDDASRERLNAILHPRIGARTQEYIDSAPADAIVVQDIPLLVEGGLGPMFHVVIVVDADVETRVSRLVGARGIDEDDARARIAAQADAAQRRAAADVWLDNSGPAGALVPVVERLWSARLVPFAEHLAEGSVPARYGGDAAIGANADVAGAAHRLEARIRLVLGGDVRSVDTARAADDSAGRAVRLQVVLGEGASAAAVGGLSAAGLVAGPGPAPRRGSVVTLRSADPGFDAAVELLPADSA